MRLALALTGNPCTALAPRLAAPSARNSWVASRSAASSSPPLKARAVRMKSVYATSRTPRAGSTRCGTSVRSGRPRSGSPAGTSPITLMPSRSSRPRTITATVPSTTASNGPGSAGAHRATANSRVRMEAENSIVAA